MMRRLDAEAVDVRYGKSMAVLLAVVAVATLCQPSALARRSNIKVKLDDNIIAVNEFVKVTVQANGRHAVLQLPETDDWTIEDATNQFAQPMFCMSMGREIISGPCIFTYYFVPQRAGELTLPSFTLVDNFWNPGQVVGRSAEATVTVKADKAANPKSRQRRGRRTRPSQRGGRQPHRIEQSNGPDVPPAEQDAIAPADLGNLAPFSRYDIFLVPHLDKGSYTLNEPFRVDFILYLTDNSGATQLEGLELPELDGFRKERLEVKESELGRARIGRKTYNRYLLARYVLVPMEAGDHVLSGARATVMASVSTMQQFGGGGFSVRIQGGSQPVEVFAPPVALSITPAPADAPAGFNPANIGAFELELVQTPPPQPAGSWVVLKYRLKGHGNLLSVAPPELAEQPGLNLRRPYLDSDHVVIDESGIHGTLEVQLPLQAERAGDFDLGNLRLVYFDPDKSAFGEAAVTLPPLTATTPAGAPEGTVSVSGSDLEGLVTDAPLVAATPERPWTTARSVLLGALALVVALLLAALARWLYDLAGRDSGKRRRKLAVRRARRELKEAAALATANETDRFYAAVLRGLSNYLEGRFGISVGSATHDQVTQGLLAGGVDEALARRVRAELESSEFGRFAPSRLQGSDMMETLKRVRELVARLDRVRGVK